MTRWRNELHVKLEDDRDYTEGDAVEIHVFSSRWPGETFLPRHVKDVVDLHARLRPERVVCGFDEADIEDMLDDGEITEGQYLVAATALRLQEKSSAAA